MLTVEVELRNAQKLKQFLAKNNLLNRDYFPKREKDSIYFPLIKLNKKQLIDLKNKNKNKKIKVKIVNKILKKTKKQVSVEELLKGKLSPTEIKLIPRAQERVGTILILEIPDKLKQKEEPIAQAFLKANNGIKTVVKKSRAHEGIYRLRKVIVLAGKKTRETIHYENNIRMVIDIEQTYFSSRLANERLRITKQIKKTKKPEEVLVMFSGAAPYPLVLAKNSPLKVVYGVEINPLAHQLALKNVLFNKLEDKIRLFEGDVNLVLPKIKKKFDRVLMPLPKTGEQFLPIALKKAKKGSIIHLYSFLDETELKKEPQLIKEICKKEKRSIRILRKVKCGQFSPAIARYCFDIKIK